MTAPSRAVVRVLAVLSVLELASLAVLLVNLFTAHLRPVTQTMGPVHGALYLTIAIIVLFAPGFRPVDRVLGCIPVAGGTIAVVRALRR
ncbi:MAG: hypothetical protein AB7K08_01230 [Microbacteriaceae bacterium]